MDETSEQSNVKPVVGDYMVVHFGVEGRNSPPCFLRDDIDLFTTNVKRARVMGYGEARDTMQRVNETLKRDGHPLADHLSIALVCLRIIQEEV